ncbi:hypothetical protein BGW42_006348, partial [Actinomortierella wolfii]
MNDSDQQHDQHASSVDSVTDASNNILALLHSLSVEQLERFEQNLRLIKQQKMLAASHVSHDAGDHATTVGPTSTSAPSLPAPGSVPVAGSSVLEIVDGIPWLTFTHKVKRQEQLVKVRVDVERVTSADIADSTFRTNNCVYPRANHPESHGRDARRLFEQECNEQGWKLTFLNKAILEGNRALIQKAVVCFRNSSTTSRSRRAFRKDKMALGLFRKHLNPRKSKKTILTAPADSSPSVQDGELRHTKRKKGPFIQWQSAQQQSAASMDTSTTSTEPMSDARYRRVQEGAPGSTVWITHTGSLHECEVVTHSSDTIGNSVSGLPLTSHKATSQALEMMPTSFSFDARLSGKTVKLELNSDIDHVLVESLPTEFKSANSVFPRAYITEDADIDEATIQWTMFGIRQAEESLLNEIGWKLCWVNQDKLAGKKLLLQQALDAYRRKFLPDTFHPRGRFGPTMHPKAWQPGRDLGQASPGQTEVTQNSLFVRGRQGLDDEALRNSETKQQEDIHCQLESHGRHLNSLHFMDANSTKFREDSSTLLADQEQTFTHEVTPMPQSELEESTVIESDSTSETNDNDQGESEEEGEDYSELTHTSVLEEIDRFLNEGSESDDSSDDGSSSDGGEHSQMSLLSITGRIRTYSLGTGSGSARSRPVERSRMQSAVRPSMHNHRASRLSTSFQYTGRQSQTTPSVQEALQEAIWPHTRSRLAFSQTDFYDDWARLYVE